MIFFYKGIKNYIGDVYPIYIMTDYYTSSSYT